MLAFTLLLVAPLVSAHCGGFGTYPQWVCDVCGNYFDVGSGPFGCLAVNATFDDIPPGALDGQYSRATWTGFDVVQQNSTFALLPQLKPYSEPNYAKLPTGTDGIITLESGTFSEVGSTYQGSLYSIRYGCALPGFGVPTSCKVTLLGFCGPAYYGLDNHTFVTTTLEYEAPNIFDTEMGYAQAILPQLVTHNGTYEDDNGCLNYSINAVNDFGLPVDLFLDDVIFGTILYRGNL